MHSYDEIFAIAAERQGGADALRAKLTPSLAPQELETVPEDRWLASFTKSIFQAGFSWKVIEAKWPGFEAAFHGFDLAKCAFMSEAEFDALLSNTALVRNGVKLASVRDNASFLLSLADQGGASKVLAHWPSTEFVGLLDLLKTKGSRLGGTSGQYALRSQGRDSFILSRDVVARLVAEGVVDKAPTSKRALAQVQAAFNTWMDQSGRGLTEISRTLAMSIG